MKLLVFGKDGQLGQHLQKVLPGAVFLGPHDLDFSNTEQIRPAILAQKPTCIINAAAYTAVDRAESEPELARTINARAVKEMAMAAQELKVPLLHVSTDYVFSGEKPTPYKEDDPTGPKSIYGKTKLEGELAVKEFCEDYWIIRTSWVFSEHGTNFVKTMLRLGEERESLSIVADQTGQPTYAGDLAELIKIVVQSLESQRPLPWGLYHFACRNAVSWYEFAQEIFEQAVNADLLSSQPQLTAITTEDYPMPASRPKNSRLDLSRLQQWLGEEIPDWKTGLAQVIKSLDGDN